jgi:hypothetical protein
VSANTPEGKVKTKIDGILKPYVRRGVLAYEKTAGSMYGKNGWPDYSGCMLGLFWAIEAKAGKKAPTDIQEVRIGDIRKAKGIVLIVNEKNVDRLDDFFQRLEQRALKIMELLHAHP